LNLLTKQHQKNFYINDKPFSKLEAHFKATFSNAFDSIVNSLIVDFLDRDVSAMVSSFGGNSCRPCQSSDQGCTHPGLATVDWCVSNCERGFCPKSHCVCGENVELCSQIQTICTGRNQQYQSQAACEAYLDSLPLTQEGCPKLKGPTQSCKWTHVILAQPELRPEIHCSHVGMETPDPFGNIKCSIADCDI